MEPWTRDDLAGGARARGLGSLLIGGLLVAFWVGGHGALYSAYRITETHAPATVVAQAE